MGGRENFLGGSGGMKRERKREPKWTYTEETVSTGSLRHGHSPDRRKENAHKDASKAPPIHIDENNKVLDGNDRLYWARKQGVSSVRVRRYVKK